MIKYSYYVDTQVERVRATDCCTVQNPTQHNACPPPNCVFTYKPSMKLLFLAMLYIVFPHLAFVILILSLTVLYVKTSQKADVRTSRVRCYTSR